MTPAWVLHLHCRSRRSSIFFIYTIEAIECMEILVQAWVLSTFPFLFMGTTRKTQAPQGFKCSWYKSFYLKMEERHVCFIPKVKFLNRWVLFSKFCLVNTWVLKWSMSSLWNPFFHIIPTSNLFPITITIFHLEHIIKYKLNRIKT